MLHSLDAGGETLNLRLLSEIVNDLIAIIYVCSTFGVGGGLNGGLALSLDRSLMDIRSVPGCLCVRLCAPVYKTKGQSLDIGVHANFACEMKRAWHGCSNRSK